MKSDSAQEVTLLKNTFYLRYFQHLVPKKAVLLLLPLTPVTPVPLACCWKGGIVGNFLAGWCDSVWRAPYLCGEEVSGSDKTSSLFVNLLSSTSISGSQRGTLRGPTGDPSSRPDGSEGLEDFQVPGKVTTEPRDTSRPLPSPTRFLFYQTHFLTLLWQFACCNGLDCSCQRCYVCTSTVNNVSRWSFTNETQSNLWNDGDYWLFNICWCRCSILCSQVNKNQRDRSENREVWTATRSCCLLWTWNMWMFCWTCRNLRVLAGKKRPLGLKTLRQVKVQRSHSLIIKRLELPLAVDSSSSFPLQTDPHVLNHIFLWFSRTWLWYGPAQWISGFPAFDGTRTVQCW